MPLSPEAEEYAQLLVRRFLKDADEKKKEGLRQAEKGGAAGKKRRLQKAHINHAIQYMNAWKISYIGACEKYLEILNESDIKKITNNIAQEIEPYLKMAIQERPQLQSVYEEMKSSVNQELNLTRDDLQLIMLDISDKIKSANQATPLKSLTSAVDLSFVNDPRIQEILKRDYAELQRLDPNTAIKSVLVLSGGIIEGLIFDALVVSSKWTFEQACKEYLNDMIGAALNRGIITEDKLTDAIRRYRNLIHPGREIKYNMVFSESDANLARHAVDILIREVKAWHQKQKIIS
jgi:hypothetical protein